MQREATSFHSASSDNRLSSSSVPALGPSSCPEPSASFSSSPLSTILRPTVSLGTGSSLYLCLDRQYNLQQYRIQPVQPTQQQSTLLESGGLQKLNEAQIDLFQLLQFLASVIITKKIFLIFLVHQFKMNKSHRYMNHHYIISQNIFPQIRKEKSFAEAVKAIVSGSLQLSCLASAKVAVKLTAVLERSTKSVKFDLSQNNAPQENSFSFLLDSFSPPVH